MQFDPDRIQAALLRSWSLRTASKWTPQNPAAGQCNVTALLVHEMFGGELLKTPLLDGDHFYNRVLGRRYDFTSVQFNAPVIYLDLLTDRMDAELGATAPQQAALRTAFLQHFPSRQERV